MHITFTTTPPVDDPSGSGTITGPGVSIASNNYLFTPSSAGPGTHTITYTFTTNEGCSNTATDQIIVHNAPDINLSASPIEALIPAFITFTNSSNFANNYTWYFGDGESMQTNQNQISHIYPVAGVYTIVLEGEGNGCFGADSITIELFNPINYGFPNVFSPNGDDSNPFFNLINMAGFEKVGDFELLILNRWGNVLRVFNDPYFTWDGTTNNGSEAADGVYFYRLRMSSLFGDDYEDHGYFHLIR